ncbi:uncharacterized protein [Argopecten irradians]|uniref:uncharacterized protein n=1 Tax=Argopecten irradians TaxID=31199 RepID=UPI00371104A6
MSPSVTTPLVTGRVTYLVIGFSYLLLITIICGLVSLHFLGDSPKHVIKTVAPPIVNKSSRAKYHSTWKNGNPRNVKPKTFIKSLVNIAQNLHHASIHAKSLKTISALRRATAEIRTLLGQLNLSYQNITERSVIRPRTVCPEEYRGAQYGADHYEKGFEAVPCEYSKPLSDSVTILMIRGNSNLSTHDTITDIQSFMPGVRTIVGQESSEGNNPDTKGDNSLAQRIFHARGMNEGQIWNNMLMEVQTEYVLVARDVNIFDKNMRIERLIRVIEMTGVPTAGGATRTTMDGKWRLGCYQSGMRNYTLVYHEGYDESVQECVICDYTDGPFVIRTKTLMEELFDEKISENGVFYDLFLRLGQEKVAVCSDSMFHVRGKEMEATSASLESFAQKWEIHKLRFVPGPEILFKCNVKTRQSCSFKTNKLQHPCCASDLVLMLSHVTSVCESRGVEYEVRSGTLLGAVKMNSVLPWDIDADINYLLSNYSVIKQLVSHFSFTGHKCHVQIAPNYDYEYKLLSASFQLDSEVTYWKVEIWGKPSFAVPTYRTAVRTNDGRPIKTRVKINDVWVQTAFNPGLWARNRYGSEVFRHAQHWRSLGKLTSLEEYSTRAFLECPEPGHHACLDNFNVDGNLQFSEPIP